MRARILNFLRIASNFIKTNWKTFFLELGKLLGVLFLLVVLAVLVSMLFFEYQTVIIKAFSVLFTVYFLTKLVRFFGIIEDKREIKQLEKLIQSPNTEPQSLYRWTGRGVLDYHFFYEILKVDSKSNTLENLREIKNSLMYSIGDNIYDYYLLKNYIEAKDRTSIGEKARSIFVGIVIGLLTTLLSRGVTSDTATKFITTFVFDSEGLKGIDNISMVLDVINLIFFLIGIITYFISEMYREKRKIELIKGVIEVIITEKEN